MVYSTINFDWWWVISTTVITTYLYAIAFKKRMHLKEGEVLLSHVALYAIISIYFFLIIPVYIFQLLACSLDYVPVEYQPRQFHFSNCKIVDMHSYVSSCWKTCLNQTVPAYWVKHKWVLYYFTLFTAGPLSVGFHWEDRLLKHWWSPVLSNW